MHITHRQEEFSRAFVQAIASAAGFKTQPGATPATNAFTAQTPRGSFHSISGRSVGVDSRVSSNYAPCVLRRIRPANELAGYHSAVRRHGRPGMAVCAGRRRHDSPLLQQLGGLPRPRLSQEPLDRPHRHSREGGNPGEWFGFSLGPRLRGGDERANFDRENVPKPGSVLLDNASYSRAIEAHGREQRIALDGELVREGAGLVLRSARNFRVREEV